MLNRIFRQFTQSPDGLYHGIPIGTDLDIKQRYDFIGTLPKGAGGAATEKMIAYGSIVGRGTGFTFTGDLFGKQLIITDSTATSVTAKTITFARASFANVQQPTAAEIVAAINAVLSADATPTVASVGTKGNIVLTGAANSATGVLTIGPGSVNQLLGFPEDGVTVRQDNAAGVSFILPATWNAQALLGRSPRLTAYDFTPSTMAKALSINVGMAWNPTTRTALITDVTPTTGVQRAVAFTFEI